MYKSFFTIVIFLPLFTIAQDSPMQAAPGSAPPPQGWSQGNPPNGGIHLPVKKPEKKYRLKMNPTGTNPPKASAVPAKGN